VFPDKRPPRCGLPFLLSLLRFSRAVFTEFPVTVVVDSVACPATEIGLSLTSLRGFPKPGYSVLFLAAVTLAAGFPGGTVAFLLVSDRCLSATKSLYRGDGGPSGSHAFAARVGGELALSLLS
jgi:hypothetical protein